MTHWTHETVRYMGHGGAGDTACGTGGKRAGFYGSNYKLRCFIITVLNLLNPWSPGANVKYTQDKNNV